MEMRLSDFKVELKQSVMHSVLLFLQSLTSRKCVPEAKNRLL